MEGALQAMILYQVESHGGSQWEPYNHTVGIYADIYFAREKAIREAAYQLRWDGPSDYSRYDIVAWENETSQIIDTYYVDHNGPSLSGPNDHWLRYLWDMFPGSRERCYGGWHIELCGHQLVRRKNEDDRPFETLPRNVRELDERLKHLGLMKLCTFCLNGSELLGQDKCQKCVDEEKRLDDEWAKEKGL